MAKCEICNRNDGTITDITVCVDEHIYHHDHMCEECYDRIDESFTIIGNRGE